MPQEPQVLALTTLIWRDSLKSIPINEVECNTPSRPRIVEIELTNILHMGLEPGKVMCVNPEELNLFKLKSQEPSSPQKNASSTD